MLTIDVLGPLVITRSDQAIKLPKKARALLAYLTVHGADALIPRSRLVDLLWPYQAPEQARHSLRNCLWELRKKLKPPAGAMDGFEAITLRPLKVASDFSTFIELSNSDRPKDLRQCCALWRGDFLAELVIPSEPWEEWLGDQRRALQSSFADLLIKCCAVFCDAGEHGLAMAAGKRLVALDPFCEQFNQALMQVYARAGLRSSALRQYEQCTKILRAELCVAPSTELTTLAHDIRMQRGSAHDASAAPLIHSLQRLAEEFTHALLPSGKLKRSQAIEARDAMLAAARKIELLTASPTALPHAA